MDEKELLKYAVDSGILDIALVQKQVTMQKREKLLNKNPIKSIKERMRTGTHICRMKLKADVKSRQSAEKRSSRKSLIIGKRERMTLQ